MNTQNTPAIHAIAPAVPVISSSLPASEQAEFSYPGVFTSAEDYQTFKKEWKVLADAKLLTPSHMAAFALLTGRSLDAAFSPITNANKLGNGACAHQGLVSALSPLRHRKELPAGLDGTSAKYHAAVVEMADAATKAITQR